MEPEFSKTSRVVNGVSLELNQYYDQAAVNLVLRTFHPNVNVDLETIPGNYSYYASLFAKAEAQYDRLCNAQDIIEAKLDKMVRKELHDAGGKVTENAVRNAVVIDSRMIEVVRLVREAKEQVTCLKGACEALKQRRDALLNLAWNLREELKGNPTITNTNTNRRSADGPASRLADSEFEI